MLHEKQLKCIEYLVYTNMTQVDIAKELDCHNSTISDWKRIAEFANALNDAIKKRFVELAVKAQKRVEELMYANSETVSLNASKDIMDRAGLKPTDKVEQVNETTIRVDISED